MESEKKANLRKSGHAELCIIWIQIVQLKLKGYREHQISDMTGMTHYRVNEIWQMYKKSGIVPQPGKRGRKVGKKTLMNISTMR